MSLQGWQRAVRNQHPASGILYRKILEESLILSQVHADLVRFESAENRYRRMCKISPQIALRAPLLFIASYLQMTPETLSRVRSTVLLD